MIELEYKTPAGLDHNFGQRRYDQAAICRVRCADQRPRGWRGGRDYDKGPPAYNATGGGLWGCCRLSANLDSNQNDANEQVHCPRVARQPPRLGSSSGFIPTTPLGTNSSLYISMPSLP